MRYIILGNKLNERKWYSGVVIRHKANSSKLVIVVRFDDDPTADYIMSIKVSSSINSHFYKVAEALDIIDEYGNVDTDYLDDTRVLATIRKGKDNCFFVNKICLDQQYYDELDEAEGREMED